jgi:exodeoxyribonuclease VII small subunit
VNAVGDCLLFADRAGGSQRRAKAVVLAPALTLRERSDRLRAMPQAPSSNVPAAAPIADFERSLDELESLVSRLEKGDLTLDDSLATFERGVALYRQCQGALEQAELRVKLLLDPLRPDRAADFEPDTP